MMRRVLIAGLAFAFCAHAADQPSPLPPSPARPEAAAGPTRVEYAVLIGDVTRIDSVAQTFTANVVLVLRWRDPRLKHDGADVNQFALDDIWHPRLLIANEAGETTRSLPEVVDVTPDGTAIYRQRFIGGFTQALDLRAFPFDSATFRVQLVALGARPQDLTFEPDPQTAAFGWHDGIGLAKTLTVQDWRVLSATTRSQPYTITPGVELAGFGFEVKAARNHSTSS